MANGHNHSSTPSVSTSADTTITTSALSSPAVTSSVPATTANTTAVTQSTDAPGFFVAINGNDQSGNGSAAAPFATLARAQQAMEGSSTHTTYIDSGTYNLNSSLILGSADNGMSFIAAPGQTPVLNGGASGLANLITLDGAHGVTVQGLTFENTNLGNGNGAVSLVDTTGDSIVGNLFNNNDRGLLLNASDNNVISGNEINNSVTAGINAGNGSDNNTIDSNLINGVSVDPGFGSGTGSAGIWITGGDSNAITHNLVENTAGAGIALESWDTNAGDTAALNVGNTIDNNSIVAANSASQATDSGGIYLDNRSGVDMQTTINNNAINQRNTPSTGTDVGIYLDDFTSGVTATNNITTGGNFGAEVHGGQNNTLSNNIFDDGSQSASNLGAILLQSEPGGPVSMSGNAITKNIFYSTASGSSNAFISYGGSADISRNLYYDTNGQTVSSNGLDSNPVTGNPQFVNEAGGNYSLGAGSAAGSIGFQGINQSPTGLAPSTAHWY